MNLILIQERQISDTTTNRHNIEEDIDFSQICPHVTGFTHPKLSSLIQFKPGDNTETGFLIRNNPRVHSSNLQPTFHVPTVSALHWKSVLKTKVKVENLSEVLLPVLVAHAVDVPVRFMEVAAKLGQDMRYFRHCLTSVLLSINVLIPI